MQFELLRGRNPLRNLALALFFVIVLAFLAPGTSAYGQVGKPTDQEQEIQILRSELQQARKEISQLKEDNAKLRKANSPSANVGATEFTTKPEPLTEEAKKRARE